MAAMDPREVFAIFRASCLKRAREIRDFIARSKSFSLNFKETQELREMRRALKDQFACMEETWDNLLQCVRLYAIDIDNNAVFGELVGVMKSTKKVIDKAFLASEQFTQVSPVCADVGVVSCLEAGEGKDEDVGEDILKEKDVNEDVDEDAEEDVLEEDVCRSGTGEDVSKDVGEDAGGDVLEEDVRRSGIGEDCDDGVNRDVSGNTDGEEIRSSRGMKNLVKHQNVFSTVCRSVYGLFSTPSGHQNRED
jgi:hypothetical protein